MLHRVARKVLSSPYSRSNRHFQGSALAAARILATDGVDECCVNIFQERGHEVDLLKTLPESELLKVIGQYDGLVVRSATKVTPTVLQAARKLRVVGRAGVGVDNIDVKAATKAGVIVMNTPGGNTVSTAQLALSLLCSMARSLPQADMAIKEGKWDRKVAGVELHGKTLGVIGCGRIGQVVANTAQKMGMSVLGFDPVLPASAFKDLGIHRADLDTLLARSDFLTVHTPLTPETSNLLNDQTLAKCKKGVRVINCARGGIVDEAALLRALQSGQVASAALDVFTSEPPKPHLAPLLQHPNLICTPHLGASTEEAQVNVARDIAQQMCDVFDQKDYLGVVNVDYLSAASHPHIQAFMQLAETLGAMQAQLSAEDGGEVVSAVLRTFGGRDVNIESKTARKLLMAMVLKGLVKHRRTTNGVPLVPDLISSPAMAADLGIQAVISEEPPRHVGSPYWNLLSLEVTRANGSTNKITGAVFGSVPHVVKVDSYSDLFAFQPQAAPYILTFRNQDKPGVISSVLDILYREKVNIAAMNVARGAAEGEALTFIALDDDVTTHAMEALKAIQSIHGLAKVQLR